MEEPTAKDYTYKWEGMDVVMPRDLLLSLPLLVKPKYNQYEHMNFSNYYKKLSRNLTRLASAGRESPTQALTRAIPNGTYCPGVTPKSKIQFNRDINQCDSDTATRPIKPKRTGIDGPIPFSLSKRAVKAQKLNFRPCGGYQSSNSGDTSDCSSLLGMSLSDNSDISEVEAVNLRHQPGLDFPSAISPTPILVDVADHDMDAMVMKNSPVTNHQEQYMDCSADDESTTDLKELEKQRGSSPEDFTGDLIDMSQLDRETEEYLTGMTTANEDVVKVTEGGGNLWMQIISGIKEDDSASDEDSNDQVSTDPDSKYGSCITRR